MFNDFSYNGLFLSMHSLNITCLLPTSPHAHTHTHIALLLVTNIQCSQRNLQHMSLLHSRSFIHLSLIACHHFLKAGACKCEQNLHLVSKSARMSDS